MLQAARRARLFWGKSPKSARPGSAAIFAVYLAGYIRTMSRADQFANEVAERRMAGRASRRVASVRDGLQAKTTLIPRGVLPAPESPGGGSAAAPPHRWKDGTWGCAGTVTCGG